MTSLDIAKSFEQPTTPTGYEGLTYTIDMQFLAQLAQRMLDDARRDLVSKVEPGARTWEDFQRVAELEAVIKNFTPDETVQIQH